MLGRRTIYQVFRVVRRLGASKRVTAATAHWLYSDRRVHIECLLQAQLSYLQTSPSYFSVRLKHRVPSRQFSASSFSMTEFAFFTALCQHC
jgi:hypothetical protein